MSRTAIRWIAICCLSVIAGINFAQDSLKSKAIAAIVQLDSVTIVATKQGFSVEDFIRLVETDKSLYQAFRNLRKASYRFKTSMSFEDKEGKVKGTYSDENRFYYDGQCQTADIRTNQQSSGDFFRGRKSKPRYYTYELYQNVFLAIHTPCGSSTSEKQDADPENAMGRQISELKKLIFTPGQKSNVPLIGRKTEIFSEEMTDLYDFTISSEVYSGIPAYVFTASVKDMYQDRENKTVFKKLITYFSKEDFQVLARVYTLSQKTAAYMFDVTMDVELVKVDARYFPKKVLYDGKWDIPTRKKEIGTFTVEFDDLK